MDQIMHIDVFSLRYFTLSYISTIIFRSVVHFQYKKVFVPFQPALSESRRFYFYDY
jgi:hypothetical protein